MSRVRAVPVFLMLVMPLTSCESPEVDPPSEEPPALEQYFPAVDRVNITVTSCSPDRFAIAVDHWVARVSPGRQATQFQWAMDRTDEVDAFEIRPVDTQDRQWPFERPSRPEQAPPHAPINLTIPPAGDVEEGRYHYGIVIHCGDRVYDIDPEIWIR